MTTKDELGRRIFHFLGAILVISSATAYQLEEVPVLRSITAFDGDFNRVSQEEN